MSTTGARSLLSYFIGAYAFTYLFWIPTAIAETGRLTLPVPSFVFLVLGGLGPMLASLVEEVAMTAGDAIRIPPDATRQIQNDDTESTFVMAGAP